MVETEKMGKMDKNSHKSHQLALYFLKKRQKSVYFLVDGVYNKVTTLYGGAPDSIAGERKNKHTADGVTAIKHST